MSDIKRHSVYSLAKSDDIVFGSAEMLSYSAF